MGTRPRIQDESPDLDRHRGDHGRGGLGAGGPRHSTPRIVRSWILPMSFVVATALLFSTAFYVLDVLLLHGKATGPLGVVEHYLNFTPELITDALPALGTIIVAALGIVLTVIAIIVQLSAERYTGVAMMFLRDSVHVAVLSFYVIASLCAMWLSVTLRVDFVPLGLMLLVMSLASLGLALMLPYFAYTFWFLEPGNLIARLRLHATQLTQRGLSASGPGEAGVFQTRLIKRMEEIADIANNSIEGEDKIVAGHAVNALCDFIVRYTAEKPAGEHAWYLIGDDLLGNLEFVGMDDKLKAELETRGLWVEWKMLHAYVSVYHKALGSMEDVNSLLAVDTRRVGEVAADTRQHDLVRMSCRFLNSFMRSAIDAGHSRTCCEVLLQYRMLLEHLLQSGFTDATCEGVTFMKEYGQIAFEQELPVITETVAYDVAKLCRTARQHQFHGEDRILRLLLDLDSEPQADGYQRQRSLRGVRSAQMSLALFYMSMGDEAQARMIADDMRGMPPDMREEVRIKLLMAAPPDSWEIVDRGRNLHYLTDEERGCIDVFMGWLASDESG
jgi:hypothetical protein